MFNAQCSMFNRGRVSALNFQFSKHEFIFFPFWRMFFYVVGEEEEFQYNEDDEQFYQYDGPQRAPQRHAAEPIIVKLPYLT